MSFAPTFVAFGEWLPDQPALSGDYLLTANNVLPMEGYYGPFKTLDTSGATLPANGTAVASTGGGVFGNIVVSGSTKGASVLYAIGNDGVTPNVFVTSLYGSSAFTARGAAGNGYEAFAQFDNIVIAVSEYHTPYKHTIGSASNFSTLTASDALKPAKVVGIINRFAIVADFLQSTLLSAQYPSLMQWSAIDDPTNWPTPNSATATATQAGEQLLQPIYGQITGIHGGDQFGVVLQKGSVTRMTYVGPPVVFQFDVIDDARGCWYEHASIKVGRLTYFISQQGFCRTDGVTVERIGLGKVDKTFLAEFDGVNVSVGYDKPNGLVQFAYTTSGSSVLRRMISFNEVTGRWTSQDISLMGLITPNPGFALGATPMAFGLTGIVGKFQATAGSATFATADIEMNVGGRTFINGIKPNIQSSGTAPAVTVRVGSRDDLGTSPSYSATTTPTTRTGFADFRADAKYHRAEVQVVGNFEKATGFVANAMQSGIT